MSSTAVDLIPATRDALQACAWRAAEMVRHLSEATVPVPHTRWTVGETAAHIAMAQGFFADLVLGETSPFDDVHNFAGINASLLEQFDERNPAKLAGTIEAETVRLLEVTESAGPESRINWHLGVQLSGQAYLSYCLYHTLAHSYDIARAMDLPNPIRAAQVNLTIPFFLEVMPLLVNKKAMGSTRARVQVRLRGGPRFTMNLDRGALTVDASSSARAHCYLSIDPVAFFLIATKLTGQVRHILAGKVLVWGSRPWLGPRIPGLLNTP